jgi:predicted secreted hydrolase
MKIQLDNGVQMSIWDKQTDDKNPKSYVGGPRRFVTILKPTGELAVAPVVIAESNPWTSTQSQRTYPNQWQVTIPGRAVLNVRSLLKGQEIVSEINTHRVEAKAEVDGTYDGKSVKGVTMVELFDLFPLFSSL